MPPSRELLSRIGVAFTIMGVAILVVDYAGQLTFHVAFVAGIEGCTGLRTVARMLIALENVGVCA